VVGDAIARAAAGRLLLLINVVRRCHHQRRLLAIRNGLEGYLFKKGQYQRNDRATNSCLARPDGSWEASGQFD